jgi:hypothetical protein
MSGQITRRLKPEEEELSRKREELASILTTLAERELELVEFRHKLAAFEGRYLRQVGKLYAQLDEWSARIMELRALLDPSPAREAAAHEARRQAHQTQEEANRVASQATADFTPSPDLKRLYRETAKNIHPDLARNAEDSHRRTRYMAEANRAYEAGDAEALLTILQKFQDDPDAVEGESVSAELIRMIRQISAANERIVSIEAEIEHLKSSEMGLLLEDVSQKQLEGIDLLAELAESLGRQIENAKVEFKTLSDRLEIR